MGLALKLLDGDGSERHLAPGATFTMGRGADNDWVLDDPAREVSKTHCRIEGDGRGVFVLTDLSINGVLVEGQETAMGPGGRHRLAEGDRFRIGPHRFAVSIAPADADSVIMPASPPSPGSAEAPAHLADILDGHSEGPEERAAASGSGEAQRWLGTLPTGAADETLHQPMGWDEPPDLEGDVLPLALDQPAASEFANRSEHVPAARGALHLPRAEQASQILPADWLDEDQAAPRERPAPRMPPSLAPGAAPRPSTDSRRPFAEAARLDPAAIGAIADEQLLRRCGEALRAFLDGIDSAEAAQAVAERDCGLPTPTDTGLWGDFFTNNRDPLLSLLVEAQPAATEVLGRRFAALADRQRALGRAVAEAGEMLDARLSPEPILADSKTRLAVGPLAEAAAWRRYVGLYGELSSKRDREATTSLLVLLRKSFARAMTKRG